VDMYGYWHVSIHHCFVVLIWRAAEFHCNIALPFILRFITFINDDNERLNAISLMYLNLLYLQPPGFKSPVQCHRAEIFRAEF